MISINGDGGMQMNIQELATAVVYGLPVIICVFNNGYLGNVRQWQEMFYKRQYASTCLRYRKGTCPKACSNPTSHCPAYTPDFVALAESYGCQALRVCGVEDMAAAFDAAKAETTRPTLIEFIIDREMNVMPMVPPGNNLSDMILESEGEI